MSGGSALAVALSFAAGFAGSVQIAVMGRFGDRIGVVPALAFSTLLTAVITAAALLLVSRSLGGYAEGVRAPPWLWLGAVAGAFIVLSITVAAPRIGTTATIAFLIAGQLGMGTVIDRFGLFGVEKIGLDVPRLVGIALLVLGAALSLRR